MVDVSGVKDAIRRIAVILDRLFAFFSAPEFSWLDVLDILIVAFILYELLQFIRGTHAVQMAIGALVLVVLYWTSLLFNLETVNWMLRTFLPTLVFGIIVIFQAEIRKVLAHLGRRPFFGAFASKEEVMMRWLAATTRSKRPGPSWS
jgi:DNA integrity scanning protein DisA with diadenylate cyclase activity